MSENKLNNKQFVLIVLIIIMCGIAIMGHDYFLAKRSKAYEDMSILLSQEPEESETDSTDSDVAVVSNATQSNDPSGKVKKPKVTYNYIGRLKIPEIKLNRGFVKYGTSANNVNYNIAIMKGSDYPNVAGGNFILASHSGSGWNAYFNKLDQLKKGNMAYVTYKGKQYSYRLTQIYKDLKSDGKVTIRRTNENKLLTLVTCKKPDYKKYYLVLMFELTEEKDI